MFMIYEGFLKMLFPELCDTSCLQICRNFVIRNFEKRSYDVSYVIICIYSLYIVLQIPCEAPYFCDCKHHLDKYPKLTLPQKTDVARQ